MQIRFQTPTLEGPGAVAVGISDGNILTGPADRADKLSGGAIRRALSVSRFSGKAGQILELVSPAGLKASRLLLAGLGKPEKFDAPAAERLAAGIVGRLFTSGEKTITFVIESPKQARIAGAARRSLSTGPSAGTCASPPALARRRRSVCIPAYGGNPPSVRSTHSLRKRSYAAAGSQMACFSRVIS